MTTTQAPPINREELLRQLEAVRPGLSPREITEQSTCFAFQNGEIFTYNDVTACRAPSPFGDTVQGALRAEKFMELLTHLPDEFISIKPGEGRLEIRGEGTRKGWRSWLALEAEIEMPFHMVEKPEKWKKLPEGFIEAISTVQHCAAKESTQYHAYACIHIHPDFVEATDNAQICRWTLPTGFSKPALVRRSSISNLSALGITGFAETDGWVHFRNKGKVTLSCRRFEEDYPNNTEYLVVEGSNVSFPKGLEKSIPLAEIFAKEDAENPRLWIELRPSKLTMKGTGISGGYREPRKLRYKGDPVRFLIAPQLLLGLIGKTHDCVIAPGRLKFENGPCEYVTCLGNPDQKPDETGGDDEGRGGEEV